MQGAFLRKYGVATTIPVTLYALNGSVFKTDAVEGGAVDVFITKDEGNEANPAASFADEGHGYSQALSATEMEAARIVLYFEDQTSPQAWLDTSVVIETYGHASAQHAFNLGSTEVDLVDAPNSTAITAIQSGLATENNVDVVKEQTDKLDSMITEDSGGNQFTVEALQNAPTAEMDAAELHTALDSYTNKAGYKATGFNVVVPDVAGTAAALHGITNGKVDAVQADATLIKAETDLLDGMIDEDSGGNQFTVEALQNAPTAEMDAAELAIGLDAYTNKANWKANVSGLATESNATANKEEIIAEADEIKTQTDKLDNMITEDSGGNIFTEEALQNAPTAEMDAAELATAMKAITGLTEGGTWTWQKISKIVSAWIAGNWRDKSGSTTIKELLDAEDGATVILEMTLSTSTPYRQITVKI